VTLALEQGELNWHRGGSNRPAWFKNKRNRPVRRCFFRRQNGASFRWTAHLISFANQKFSKA